MKKNIHVDSVIAPQNYFILSPSYAEVSFASNKAPAEPLQKKSQSIRNMLNILLAIILIAGNVWLFFTLQSTRLFTVLSGSMEPTIMTGSVIAVKTVNSTTPVVGDVITFRSPKGTTTHRVAKILTDEHGLRYRTHGDANNVADPKLVSPDQVIGIVQTSLPLLGYFLNWLHTKTGFALIILLPATIVTLQELQNIRKNWNQLRKPNFAMSGILTTILLFTIAPTTWAVFSDSAQLNNSQFSTSTVFPSPTPSVAPTATPSISPTPSPTPTTSPDPCDLDVDADLSNNNTGPNSNNENELDIDHNCDIDVDNNVDIENDIDIDVNTGHNNSNNNTNGGNSSSGNVNINLDITNQ